MRRALELVKEEGMGCEVASPGELEQALRAGFRTRDIVFDEPAKTAAVLRRVFEAGVNLNIDNFQEYSRVVELVDAASMRCRYRLPHQSTGWLRQYWRHEHRDPFFKIWRGAGRRG